MSTRSIVVVGEKNRACLYSFVFLCGKRVEHDESTRMSSVLRVDISGAPEGVLGPLYVDESVVAGVGLSNHDILSALEAHVCRDIESFYHVKCVYKGKKLDIHDTSPNPLFSDSKQGQKRVSVILTPRNAAEKIHGMKEMNTRMPDMEYELEREKRRREYTNPQGNTRKNGRVGSLQTYEYSGIKVYPGREEAARLLRMIVDDPGIRHLMDIYDWKIGVVSEMAPEGFVGVSPMCILGVNIDHGREVSLRLRTDDLQGFRRFDMIRSTMIHELAHMRYSEHDDDFKRFNRELTDQANKVTQSHARTVSLQAVKKYPEVPRSDTPVQEPHRFSRKEWSHTSTQEARVAAGAAALQRNSSRDGPQSFRIPCESHSPGPEAMFAKGEDVLYYNRTSDTWQNARIISVDNSVQPPSFGIEIDSPDLEHPIQRETEASRLCRRHTHIDAIKGIDHDDATTRQLEERVATRFE